MILRLIKRPVCDADVGFGKAKTLYFVQGHPGLKVCDAIEELLGVSREPGESLMLSIFPIEVGPHEGTPTATLMAELQYRFDKEKR